MNLNSRASQLPLSKRNSTTKRSSAGASMVEYSILLALVALVCLAMLRTMGEEVAETFSTVASEVAAVAEGD